MTATEFFQAIADLIGIVFSDNLTVLGLPLWTLLVGATIFLAILKFIKGKGSGS